MGAYVDISYATPRKLKEKYGKLAYVIYAIQQLNQNLQFYNVKYEVNGEVKDLRAKIEEDSILNILTFNTKYMFEGIEIKQYDKRQVILFNSYSRGKEEVLSNHHVCRLSYNGIVFNSSEQLFFWLLLLVLL